ncbi:helix-turn-helix transcriptional regulator [Leuconostoc suionicum]|uniref:helix-turn-helix domain-containing protein n=1 Tax=Leuconostoc suionicum TaxID=1511761 RepID=UPI00300D75B9
MEIRFPIQLKKLRTGLSMSQEDIAGKLYISRQAVSRWESGDATPDMSNLIKLAEIFDCSLDTLVLGIEPKQDNIDDRIDHNEFVFDPRKGKYIRRRSEHMNFWEFAAAYWWAAIPIVAILGGTIPDIIQAFK